MRAKSGAFGAVEGVRGSRARLRAKSGAFGAVLLCSEPASTVQVVGRMGAVARGDTKFQKTKNVQSENNVAKTHPVITDRQTDRQTDRRRQKVSRKFVPDFYSLLRKK